MIGPRSRVAVYYAPATDDPLWERAAAWLGRDSRFDALLPQPGVAGIAEATAEPRLYGFHATLKPPMRLDNGSDWNALVADAQRVAALVAPFDLPDLSVQDLHGFLALRENRPSPELQALADAFVSGLDAYRAPPSPDELAGRRRARLTPAQDAMLVRWGYPYVFETWFFHLTLTRRLTAEEHAVFRPAAEAHFAPALAVSRRVNDVCLFTQPSVGLPFTVALRIPLGGGCPG